MDVLAQMIRDGKVTASEVVDAALTILIRHLPRKEICDALLGRIARAPLDQFN